MWYVVQARSGEEQEIKLYIEKTAEPGLCRVILPLYEDVYRRGGIGHIAVKKLFPGYLFIETEDPDVVYRHIRRIPHFTRMLAMDETEREKTFLTVGSEDEEFIRSLTEDGLMHVSYIRRAKSGLIEEITGPLRLYSSHIKKLDIPHRRAIVEADILGKHRKIKYPLWTDADPHLAWLDAKRDTESEPLSTKTWDLGIHDGDKAKDETGIYGDLEFTVTKVDPARRIVYATAEMFGTKVRFEMNADDLAVIY